MIIYYTYGFKWWNKKLIWVTGRLTYGSKPSLRACNECEWIVPGTIVE